MMIRAGTLLLLWICTAATSDIAIADEVQPSEFSGMSQTELEERLAELDSRLGQLAEPAMRTGAGAVGFRSNPRLQNTDEEWVRLRFESPVSFDEIVLVPCIWRDLDSTVRPDGFPQKFRIVAGDDKGVESVVAVHETPEEFLDRVTPLILSCECRDVSWLRLEAMSLTRRAWDLQYILQLSEIAVFGGDSNVALGAVVEVSTREESTSRSRSPEYLVDGFVPYLMDARQGDQSIAFVSETGVTPNSWFIVDLGQVSSLDRIQLHTIELSDMVPQVEFADFGIPRKLVVEGSLTPDFDKPRLLTVIEVTSVFEAGPILVRRFEPVECQYVRLRIAIPWSPIDNPDRTQAGFAEIQLFSDGVNMALNRPVTSNLLPAGKSRRLSALTDGNNLYGRILGIREWYCQLAERYELERERPMVSNALNVIYRRQQRNVTFLIVLAVVLALIAVIAILVGWMMRQTGILETRQRIAADIHDELGANIHAIGLLSDLAQKSSNQPERLKSLMCRLRDMTQRTGTAAASFSNLLDSQVLCQDLEQEMRRSSARILADVEYEISVDDEGGLARLQPRRRIDLFLFYKECLTNILKHSQANYVSTKLVAGADRVSLTVTDNGKGLGDVERDSVPHSLRRRARLLRGTVNVERAASGGIRVSLLIATHRRFWQL